MNGRYNFKKLLEEGTGEETGAVDKYFDYITDNFTRDDKASGGNGVISIIDWDGFSIRNYNSPAGSSHSVVKVSLAVKYTCGNVITIFSSDSACGKAVWQTWENL